MSRTTVPGRPGARATPRTTARLRRRGSARLAAVLLGVAVGIACSARTPYVRLSPDREAPPPSFRLVLVGDAGEMREPEPVLEATATMARAYPDRTTVVYLGDNAYPAGFSGGDTAMARAAATVRRQAAVGGPGTDVVFLPGNHDWARYTRGGLAALRRQAEFVRSIGARFLPATPGCPGPDVEDLPAHAPVVRLVTLDTQWWLHEYERGDGCEGETRDEFVAALRSALRTPLPVVIAGHHPLATHGKHGGFADWTAHLFPLHELPGMHWAWLPLPGLGSLYPLGRKLRRHDQDLGGPRNVDMRSAIAEAVAGESASPLVVYAAGHDHSQQVLRGPDVDITLVTGGGASRNETPVGCGADTLYAHEAPGFMVLDVSAAGAALAVVDPARPETMRRWFRLARADGAATPVSRGGRSCPSR